MTNPKISVIIPVYNVEPYLEYCLESILNQTMIEDIEVLMQEISDLEKPEENIFILWTLMII